MSRSEFFAQAALRYVDELDAEPVTDQINLAVGSLDGEDRSTRDAARTGRRALANQDCEW